jgi:outer membrane receptor for ferrienterochelin and colicins
MIEKAFKFPIIFLAIILVFSFSFEAAEYSAEDESDKTLKGEKLETEAKEEEKSSQYSIQKDKEKMSVADVLGGTSGVRVQTMCTNCNVANVTMCGQSDERVQVWKDGLPVMGGLGAIYILSVMPSQEIAQTEIVRGASTVLSGSEAGAGAMVFHTQTPEKRPYIFASADAGSFGWQSQKLLASGQLGKWGGQLTFTNSKSDGIDPNGDGNFNLAEFDRRTIAGNVFFDITQNSKLSFSALNYREDQRGGKGAYSGDIPFELGQFFIEDIDIRRNEYSLSWDHQFRDYSRISFRARYADRDQDTSDNFSIQDQPYMRVDEKAKASELLYERGFFDRHIFTMGILYRKLEVDGIQLKKDILFPDGQSIADIVEQKGAFAQIDFSLPARLSLTTGLRYDDYGDFGSRASPRTRLAWKATPQLSLTLSAGYGFMAPRPIFERVCCGARVQSNANVKSEVSRNILMDIDYVPRQWLKLRGSYFYSDFKDFIQKVISYVNAYYIPNFQQVNYQDVTFEGGEISLEMRFFDHFSYGFEFTRLRAMSDEPLKIFPFSGLPDDSPYKVFLAPINYDLPPGKTPYHPWRQGSAFMKWDDQKRGINISAQAQYTGSMIIQKLEEHEGFANFLAETPDFWVYNFSTKFRIYKGLSLYAGIDNITDEYQLWLDDPRYEYNWGPLRGRYYYGGLAFEM